MNFRSSFHTLNLEFRDEFKRYVESFDYKCAEFIHYSDRDKYGFFTDCESDILQYLAEIYQDKRICKKPSLIFYRISH
jgi:hypothetical protein